MKRNQKFALVGLIFTFLIALGAYSLFGAVCPDDEPYVYIYSPDVSALKENQNKVQMAYFGTPIERLNAQMIKVGTPLPRRWAVTLMAYVAGLNRHPHPGRYFAGNGTTVIGLIRNMRNGHQTPIRLVISSSTHTIEDVGDYLAQTLEPGREDLYEALHDEDLLSKYGVTQETAITLFLPDTYEVYWSTTPEALLERMAREREAFWTEKRQAALNGMTREEVITLASIIEKETQYAPERARVAGMYINRLHRGMPLQADPTVIFAIGDFSIRRVTHAHLETESPYNTYRHAGLPPGPICIPSKGAIDAVLHHEKHNYLYMCAKEDFSGSHNFAVTYAEHLKNAAKYSRALDERGIH